MSELERQKAASVALAGELAKLEPVTKPFDFNSLVPAQRTGGMTREEWDQGRERDKRLANLKASGVVPVITEQDAQWLVEDSLPRETHALREVRLWHVARTDGRLPGMSVIVLVGEKGRGKTVAAAWLLSRTESSRLYCTAEQLRQSFRGQRPIERELYHKARKVECLVIDEIGREMDIESADACLFDVMNSRRGRLGHRRSWTVLAGNISEPDFMRRYDESTRDRILQCGMVITCQGENLRVPLVERLEKGDL
jgi:hypothetical protein